MSADCQLRIGPGRPCLALLFAAGLTTAFSPALSLAGSREAVQAYNLGNKRYKDGKYVEAAESYKKCLALGARNADVYYNLGNAYFQAGDLGRAILAYERARRLSPRDPDLLGNLQQANLLARDEIDTPPRSGPGAALELGLSRVAVDELAWATSVAYLIAIALLLLRLALRSDVARRTLGAAAVVCLLVACAELGTLGAKLHRERSDRSAVVLAQEVNVRSGPSENFDTVFQLHAGTVVSLTETRGVWHRVEATPKLTGWLRKDAVEGIR